MWNDLNSLDANQEKGKVIFRAFILALASGFLLASCIISKSKHRAEINDLPGAFIYAEGKSSVSGVYREAAELLKKRKFEEAEIIYRRIIEIEPDNYQGFIGLGGSLLYQDQLEGAQQAYQQALGLSPQSVGALIGLGSVYYLQGQYLEADDLYSQVLEIEGDVADAHWGRAIVLEQLGKVEEAVYHLERFIELAPNSQLAGDARLRIEELKTKAIEKE